MEGLLGWDPHSQYQSSGTQEQHSRVTEKRCQTRCCQWQRRTKALCGEAQLTPVCLIVQVAFRVRLRRWDIGIKGTGHASSEKE